MEERRGSAAQLAGGDPLSVRLDQLLGTTVGSVLFDQLAHLVGEWRGLEARLAQTYSSLLRLLIDDVASNPSSEHVLAVAARLIQSRCSSVPIRVHAGTSAEIAERLAGDTESLAALDRLFARLGLLEDAAGPTPVTGEPAAASSAVETRVTNAYRQHLEPRRDEIDRLQDMLAQKVREAITQNKEFGDLLRIEHNALRRAESIEEVSALRQIVIDQVHVVIPGFSSGR